MIYKKGLQRVFWRITDWGHGVLELCLVFWCDQDQFIWFGWHQACVRSTKASLSSQHSNKVVGLQFSQTTTNASMYCNLLKPNVIKHCCLGLWSAVLMYVNTEHLKCITISVLSKQITMLLPIAFTLRAFKKRWYFCKVSCQLKTALHEQPERTV